MSAMNLPAAAAAGASVACPPDTVLGFDFGTRRVGVALGNGLTRIAHPLAVIRAGGPAAAPAFWQALSTLLGHWQPAVLVVGVARHPDGAAHAMTARCERFARQLEGRFGLPVVRVDERYSSAVLVGRRRRGAAGSAARDPVDDDAAAAVILQQWFDECAGAAAAPGARSC